MKYPITQSLHAEQEEFIIPSTTAIAKLFQVKLDRINEAWD